MISAFEWVLQSIILLFGMTMNLFFNFQFSIFNLIDPPPTTSKEDLQRGAANVAVVEAGLPTCLLHFFFFFV